MKTNLFRFAGLVLLVTGFLVSCATTVPVKVTRPAELDLGGAKSISVLPIGYPNEAWKSMSYFEALVARQLGLIKSADSPEAHIASQLGQMLTAGLIKAPYFTVIDDKDVSAYLKSSVGEPPVQVYLTGDLTKFETNISSRNEKRKKGDLTYDVSVYYRYVNLELTYKVIDARSKNIIAYKSRTINASTSTYDSYGDVPSPESTVSYQLEDMVSTILKEIQPYDVTLYLTLLADETKDPAMKEADKLVNDGFTQKGYEAFVEIYRKTGNFAAGYNAAYLQVALGNLAEARKMMQALADASSDKRALQAVKDIDAEIASSKKLAKQLGN